VRRSERLRRQFKTEVVILIHHPLQSCSFIMAVAEEDLQD